MKRIAPRGVTLVELLIVAGIFSLVSVVIAQVFFTIMRSNTKTDTAQTVKDSGERAMEFMSRLVQNAQSIDVAAASCPERPAAGSALSEILLTNADNGQTTLKCVEQTVDGTQIARIASVSASQTVYLTGTDVSLGSTTANTCTDTLSFTCNSVGTIPAYITISYTLRQKDLGGDVAQAASSVFESTVTVRNRQ